MSAFASSRKLDASFISWRTVVSPAVDGDGVRTKAVHQLVHDDVGEERVERQMALVVGREHDLRNRHQRLRELRVLHVLEHHALGALLARHALVVRQVEGGRLNAAVAVAGGEDLVHHHERREGPELRVAQRRIDRQVVLDILQLAAELLDLRALLLVEDRDVRLERRLVVEELVLVDLVRANRRLDRCLSAPSRRRRCRSSRSTGTHPRASSRKALSVGSVASAAASRRSARGADQLVLILEAVRHGGQPAGRRATDRREESGRPGAVGVRQRLNPASRSPPRAASAG